MVTEMTDMLLVQCLGWRSQCYAGCARTDGKSCEAVEVEMELFGGACCIMGIERLTIYLSSRFWLGVE